MATATKAHTSTSVTPVTRENDVASIPMKKKPPKKMATAAYPTISLSDVYGDLLDENDEATTFIAELQKVLPTLADRFRERGVSAFQLERLTIEEDNWVASDAEDGDEPLGKALDAVLVTHAAFRSYYSKPYDFKATIKPLADCMSFGGIVGRGVFGIHADGTTSDANPEGTCKTCPMAQFVDANGVQRTPPCRRHEILLAVNYGDPRPYTVRLSPASIGAWNAYLKLLSKKMLSLHEVVTRLTFTKEKVSSQVSYYKVEFAVLGVLPKDEAAVMGQYGEALREGLAMIDEGIVERPALPAASGARVRVEEVPAGALESLSDTPANTGAQAF